MELFVKCEFCNRKMDATDEVFPVRIFDGPDDQFPHYVPCCCMDCAKALIEKQLDDLLLRYKTIDDQKVLGVSFKKYVCGGPMFPQPEDEEPRSTFSLFGGKRKNQKPAEKPPKVTVPKTAAHNQKKPQAPKPPQYQIPAANPQQPKKNQMPLPQPDYRYQRPQQRPASIQQPAAAGRVPMGQNRGQRPVPAGQQNAYQQQHSQRSQHPQYQQQPRRQSSQVPGNGQYQKRQTPAGQAQVMYPQHAQRPAAQRPVQPQQRYAHTNQRPQQEHTASRQPVHQNRYL